MLSVPCQQFAQSAMYLPVCDEPVVLLDLSLAIHTLRVEKKPLLSPLPIESLSESEDGSGDQQMTPELSNEAFSAKSTQFIQSKRRKEPYNIALVSFKRGM
jgi:hypothetical protein